jgi:hypothetical protein
MVEYRQVRIGRRCALDSHGLRRFSWGLLLGAVNNVDARRGSYEVLGSLESAAAPKVVPGPNGDGPREDYGETLQPQAVKEPYCSDDWDDDREDDQAKTE